MTESTDKQLPDEQQLDEYLKGDSSVSQHYRQLHSAEVPADLDRLVLRQAEDAAKSRSTQGRPAWVRWTAPLAVAASAVLVLSIVIETGVRDETAVLQAPKPMQAEQRERAELKVEGRIVSEQLAPASGFVPPAEVASEPAVEEKRADHTARLRRAPAAPAQDVVTPAAPPPPKLETPLPQELRSAEPMYAAPQAPPAESVSEAPEEVVQNSVPAPAASAAPKIMPARIPARSVGSAAEEAAKLLQSFDEAAQKQSAAADEAHREEERSAAQGAYSRQISAPAPVPKELYADPETWLKDIRQLRKDNKQEQADREWRRFRTAFPNYEVAETDAAREAESSEAKK